MSVQQISLSEQDAYVLRRALARLETKDLPVSPGVALLLSGLDMQQSADWNRLSEIINKFPDLQKQVLAHDPKGPAPEQTATATDDEVVYIPPLPVYSRLSDESRKAAEGVGRWQQDYRRWATQRSPMTPAHFVETGGVWALGLAVGRRCCIHLHKPIFPNEYVMWVADSTVYSKTTGLEAVIDLVDAAMPHMRLPEQSTPEALVSMLSGETPENFDQLPEREQQIDREGRRFAAQRGIILDEVSSLLGSGRRDHMRGIDEMFMRFYDGGRYSYTTRNKGKIVIPQGQIALLGGTTPSSLSRNITLDNWFDGKLARWLFLFPEDDPVYQPDTGDYDPPADLVSRLVKLHRQSLPPPSEESVETGQKSGPVIYASMTPEAMTVYKNYFKAVRYEMLLKQHGLDPRLRASYGRLHVHMMKLALALACVDWSEAGAKGVPVIELGHAVSGQQWAEISRACLHRMLHVMSEGSDVQTGIRVIEVLSRHPQGLPLWDLNRRSGIAQKQLEQSLKTLMDAGEVELVSRQGRRGPAAKVYRIPEKTSQTV